MTAEERCPGSFKEGTPNWNDDETRIIDCECPVCGRYLREMSNRLILPLHKHTNPKHRAAIARGWAKFWAELRAQDAQKSKSFSEEVES